MSNLGKFAIVIIIVIIVLGILSPLISRHPHNLPSGSALESPSWEHWLGTDDLGIDIWAQICHGARASTFVGAGTALLAGVGGSIVGMLSGYLGGDSDRIIMRISDMAMALPDMPTTIILGAFFGPSLKNIIIAISLYSWVAPARLVRSKVLAIKEENYMKAAKSYGANFWHMTKVHFLPQVLPLIAVSMIRLFSKAVVVEAGLSFLGLGDPTSKSWGVILHHAINFKGIYFTEYWKWWLVSPVFIMMSFTTSLAIISRELERLWNGKIEWI